MRKKDIYLSMYLPFLDLFIPLCKSIFPSGIVFLLYERLLIFFYSAGLLVIHSAFVYVKKICFCLLKGIFLEIEFHPG